MNKPDDALSCLAEEELGGGVFAAEDAEADEAGQEGDDLRAREMGEADYLVEGVAALYDVE